MSNNAEFTIARLEIKVKNLNKQVVEKQNALNDALNQVKDLSTENEKLKRKLKKHETPAEHYDYSWSWISKIVFLVTLANKPLRSAEIIEVLQKKELILHEKVSKEKFLSAFLNMAMQHGRLIPYKLKGVRGNYYCLPEWVDEEGKLKPEMRRKIY
ncbi:hypothetical protein CJD36_021495 [Flavipsychrobacter stenotrophus]|uniref:Uncharacterized protein n=1 Tax=Flavipsychrobacter stenotrophus TaxID=2077091 RepID=A0A2S7SQU7_9BACT|nr:hypothetical protein [Flavipsychrobacter stenotrophus]PQJ08985.1 hypothetical protein CJD36_021495 [Flavipsychrobacter stenotrophus]